MIETEVCGMIDEMDEVTALVGDRIMDKDYRASEWSGAVNYKNEEIDVIDQFGYIHPSIVVDSGEIQRSPNLRGAGRYYQVVNIWIFTPRGVQGHKDMQTIRNKIIRLHEETVPTRPMLMLKGAVALDDGKNLFSRIMFDATFIPSEAGEVPPQLQEEPEP